MRKKNLMIAMTSALVIAMAGLMMSACGSKTAGADTTAATESTAESESTSAGAEDAESAEAESGAEAEEDKGARYLESHPVEFFGNITSVDQENSQIHFEGSAVGADGDEDGATQEVVFNMAEGVPVIDAASGETVAWDDIDTSLPAYVWTSQAMTMSLPPQTAAQVVVVNVPADGIVPQYVVVQSAETDDKGNVTITDQNGYQYVAAPDAEVQPYLTKNIVRLADVQPGTACMIWLGDTMTTSEPPMYSAEKLMVFAWTVDVAE